MRWPPNWPSPPGIFSSTSAGRRRSPRAPDGICTTGSRSRRRNVARWAPTATAALTNSSWLGSDRSDPDDAVLSEEGVQPGETSGKPDAGHGDRRIWIVDPLDGTREFSEGRADFAVHVALVDQGVPVAGAVALPGDDLVLTTADPPSLPPRPAGPLRILVSRTRPPAEVGAVAERLGAELVPMGSAGAKTMAVVRGDGDIYLHSGGQYEWDSAAPVAVAPRAAGVHASRLDGSDLLLRPSRPLAPRPSDLPTRTAGRGPLGAPDGPVVCRR